MSRYYDYDYDRNCIIGFGPDDAHCDNYNNISRTSSQSGDSLPNLPPSYDEDTSEADDDVLYILPADPESIESLNLKPIELDVPFVLVSDLLKQRTFQAITAIFNDSMDPHTSHNHLIHHHTITMDGANPYQSMQRVDDFNGSYYNAFGTKTLHPNTYHIWRFQLLGHSPSIIGIIECDDNDKNSSQHSELNGAYFGCMPSQNAYSFNTITAQCYSSVTKQQPIYQQMLQNGVLDHPMIIDVQLDLYRGTMAITNKTNGSKHCGKEILLFADIDTHKTYKLALALLGPETINLF